MLIEIDIPQVLAFVGGAVAAYLIVKRKLHDLRLLIDAADDAATDDTVTEAEFQAIWAAVKALIRKEG